MSYIQGFISASSGMERNRGQTFFRLDPSVASEVTKVVFALSVVKSRLYCRVIVLHWVWQVLNMGWFVCDAEFGRASELLDAFLHHRVLLETYKQRHLYTAKLRLIKTLCCIKYACSDPSITEWFKGSVAV